MSGEASWFVASKLFTLTILSGVPVWTSDEAGHIAQSLKARFGPRIPAVEQLIEAQRGPLSLAELDPAGRADAPLPSAAIIEDRDVKPGARPPKHVKPPPPIHASIYLRVRVKPTREGFNMILEVTAPVRRTTLDALARAVAAALFPDAKPDTLTLN